MDTQQNSCNTNKEFQQSSCKPNEKMDENEEMKVDEELYSRQLYVIGHDAMKKMMNTKVLMIGLDGLGQEISKNVCLAGIKSLSLYDKTPVTEDSLLSGFFHKKKNVGEEKDSSALELLRRLNKYVKVNVADEIEVEKYDIVVTANQEIEFNLKLNEECHAKNVKFVMANTSGLFSQIFCDFQNHSCIDKNGETISMGVINHITETGLLTVADGSHHNMENGDSVKISHFKEIFPVKVVSRSQLQLVDYQNEEILVGGDFEQVKIPFTIEFRSLKESLSDPEIMNFDVTNENRSKIIHSLFLKQCSNDGEENEEYKKLEEQFSNTKGCLIPPICSIVGGFTAQEVIKGASSKFLPIKQFYYFDSADSYLGDAYAQDAKSEKTLPRYEGMVKIFGSEGFEKIKAAKIFLVGAGAIGCENLKNFVCSGLGTDGKIFVTDMDSIEKSNLNRQFLFTEDDVGKTKSESAIKRVFDLNEDFVRAKNKENETISQEIEDLTIGKGGINLECFTTAVSKDTEDVFTDKFIENVDIISNALDNVEARAYMDERCIKSRRPMVDAGTLGTKGHVQVVIPFISESYSSSVDPQEKSIPLCTIKSYPYSIDHTIEWALSEFQAHFNDNILKLQEAVEKYNKKQEIDDQELLEAYTQAPRTVEECLKGSLALFVNNYSTSIQNLLNTFPADHRNEDGSLFWIPPKKIPAPISFNINDPIHILFVESAANLYAESHGIRKIKIEEIFAFLENVLSLKEPNPIQFSDNKVDFSRLNPIVFDKDSWHANFIYACSNLRARNYKIKERSKHHIVGIAGKIIPAIATTTAIVSGLATLEIFKYITRRDSRLDNSSTAEACVLNSKNSFLDLAFPFLASTDLVKPKTQYYECFNKKVRYNIWSRIEIPDCTLEDVIKFIEEKVGVAVGMISIEAKVVFWNICDKYLKNLKTKVSELCRKREGQSLVYLDVLTENDVDLVNVAVIFDK